MNQPRVLLSVADLEARSGVSRHTWRSWLRARRLPAVRLGRRLLVTEEDFRAYVAQNRVPAHEERGR